MLLYRDCERMTKTAPEEIEAILVYLGRKDLDSQGQVKDRHLGQVLVYAQMWKNGSLQELIDRLTIRCGISSRYIKENYVQPLITEGILRIVRMQHDVCWNWVGVPKKTSFTQYVEENPKKTEEEVKK